MPSRAWREEVRRLALAGLPERRVRYIATSQYG